MENHLSRRNFLALSGAALATPHLPGFLAERKHRKAVKIGMVQGDMSLLEKFKLVKELGFDGIEMASPNNLDTREVLEARDASGLPIHGVVDSVHWNVPFSHPDRKMREAGRKGLETALRDAKAYGASTVLLVPAVVRAEISYGSAYRRSQAEIRKVLPLAAELEVAIALENVWNSFLLSPVEMARYIDEFESPWIGAYFDVGNILRYGWPSHWIEELGTRILKVDVKEYSRQKRFNVELTEGDVNWPAVMTAFDAVPYQGWFTAEVRGGDRDRLENIATGMDRIFKS